MGGLESLILIKKTSVSREIAKTATMPTTTNMPTTIRTKLTFGFLIIRQRLGLILITQVSSTRVVGKGSLRNKVAGAVAWRALNLYILKRFR